MSALRIAAGLLTGRGGACAQRPEDAEAAEGYVGMQLSNLCRDQVAALCESDKPETPVNQTNQKRSRDQAAPIAPAGFSCPLRSSA